MMSFLSAELGGLIRHMDLMSSFVLVVLLLMSIVCWTIFLYKLLQLRKWSKENQLLIKKLKSLNDISQIRFQSYSGEVKGGYYILSSLVRYIEHCQQRASGPYLSHQAWESVQLMADQLVEGALHQMESGLTFLSTSAAVAPLLGLFGTVWGLVHAFIAIGKMHSTDISSVAPGIAQALVTTLAGLLVAIPAVVMYNYLTAKIRTFEQELYDLCAKWDALVQHTLVRQG